MGVKKTTTDPKAFNDAVQASALWAAIKGEGYFPGHALRWMKRDAESAFEAYNGQTKPDGTDDEVTRGLRFRVWAVTGGWWRLTFLSCSIPLDMRTPEQKAADERAEVEAMESRRLRAVRVAMLRADAFAAAAAEPVNLQTGALRLCPRDRVWVEGVMFSSHVVGTIRDCALEDGRDPDEAVAENARRMYEGETIREGELAGLPSYGPEVFLTVLPNAIVAEGLTGLEQLERSAAADGVRCFRLAPGSFVEVEGRTFRVEACGPGEGDGAKLVEVHPSKLPRADQSFNEWAPKQPQTAVEFLDGRTFRLGDRVAFATKHGTDGEGTIIGFGRTMGSTTLRLDDLHISDRRGGLDGGRRITQEPGWFCRIRDHGIFGGEITRPEAPEDVAQREAAEARRAFFDLFPTSVDAQSFEDEAVSIGDELLPDFARAARDEKTPTAEYWRWLAEQTRARAEETKGSVQFVFADREANEFVTLGGAGFTSPELARREFEALPRATSETSIVADLLDEDAAIVDDCYVTRETVEAKLGELFEALFERGRERNREVNAKVRGLVAPGDSTADGGAPSE